MARPHTPANPIGVKPITASEMLDCSRAQIYRMIGDGQLRRIPMGEGGSAVRIPIEDVYALLKMEVPAAP
jgi:excisionase family DNA binding protein